MTTYYVAYLGDKLYVRMVLDERAHAVGFTILGGVNQRGEPFLCRRQLGAAD